MDTQKKRNYADPIMFRPKPEDRKVLEKMSVEQDRPLSSLVRIIVGEYLKKNKSSQ